MALLVATTARSVFAERDWDPAKTWLFAVGVLEWQAGHEWPAMESAKPGRRDVQLVDYFKKQGLPDGHVVYLQDRQATRQHITANFHRLLAQTAEDDLLVFYYTGHGFRDHGKHAVFFANYDASDGDHAWPVSEIFETIENGFRGRRAVLMADCCYSGALVDHMQRHKSAIEFACLCSSFSHNSSTGNWTFTDSLLNGWRGSPTVDEDGDGAIQWRELANVAETDMAFLEQQKAVWAASESFNKEMKLASAPGKKKPGIGDRLEAKWKDKWYRAVVIDTNGTRLKIHYAGYGSEWDEWVGRERTRPFRPAGFSPGAKVSVRWEGKWYPATVKRAWYGLHFVHYDNYAAEWNEWVAPHDIRNR